MRLFGPIFCLGGALTVAAPAVAQDTPPAAESAASEESEEDEGAIIVYGRPIGESPGQTATRTGTPLLDVPFAVSTVTSELVELRGVQNIGQALETVPGVSRNFGFTGNQRFRLRGFTNVSNLRDGFRQNVVQPEVDLAGIEAIEVLKGPASALYGRYEPGGVINFVSRMPEREFGARFSATGGSYDYYRATADLTGPLDQDGTAAYRVIGAYTNAGSFRDYVNSEQIFASAALRLELGAGTRLDLRGEYLHYEGDFDRGLGNNAVFLTVPVSRNYGGPDLFIEKDQYVASARLTHQLGGDWEIRLGGFFAQTDVPEERFFNYGSPIVAGTTVNRRYVRYGFESQRDRTVQAEATGTQTTGPLTHRLLFGYEYGYDLWRFGDSARGPNIGTPLGASATNDFPEPTGLYSNGFYKFRTHAIYAQDEIAIGERIRVLIGGRQEWTRGMAEDSFFGPFPAAAREHSPFSPRAGLTFKATPDISLYASWARSQRVEVDFGLVPGGGLPAPTRGEQLEGGIKAVLFDNRVEATLAVYDLRKRDAIVANPADFNTVIQVGEIASRGIEFELSARPVPQLTLVGAFTYSDAYVSRDPGTIQGNRLTGIPEIQARLFGTYAFDGPLAGFSLGGGIFHSSDQASNSANTFFLPGFTRVDLVATYDIGPARLRLNVENLFDKTYYFTGGFAQIYPQPPRTVLASVEFAFGGRSR